MLFKNDRFPLFVLAALATIWNYSFGIFDHQEHLPVLFRLLDPDYLPHDTFVNANTQGYNPRALFFLTISPLCSIFGVAAVYIIGAFCTNCFLAKASHALAQHLFPDQPRAGLWAAVLTMAGATASLGESGGLRCYYFIPSCAVLPFLAYGLLWLLRGRPVRAALCFSVGAVVHPLLSPLSAAMCFGLYAFRQMWTHRGAWRAYFPILGAGALMAGCMGAILLPYIFENLAAQKIQPEEFVKIYAHFRNPHHFLASRFLTPDERWAGFGWLAVLGIGLVGLYRFSPTRRPDFWMLAGLCALILMLLPLGYYFVEVRPSRIWATIQIFRFLVWLKWLVWVLLAGLVARWGARGALAAAAGLHPWALAASVVSAGLSPKSRVWVGLSWALGALALGWAGYRGWQSTAQSAQAYWYAVAVLGWTPALLATSGFRLKMAYTALTVLTIGVFGHIATHPRRATDSPLRQALSRQWTLAELPSDWQPLAAHLAKATPADAVLLAPPHSSDLRLLAPRALVVDFKTLPFEDNALKTWYATLFDCYGYTDQLGFDAVQWAFKPNYLYSTDSLFLALGQRYHAQYAVLYAPTASQLPVLYRDSLYKLVQLAPVH